MSRDSKYRAKLKCKLKIMGFFCFVSFWVFLCPLFYKVQFYLEAATQVYRLGLFDRKNIKAAFTTLLYSR